MKNHTNKDPNFNISHKPGTQTLEDKFAFQFQPFALNRIS